MFICLYAYMNKGLLLVFSTAIISGFSIFINKYGVAINNPYVFAFLKNTLVAMLFICLIFAAKERSLLRKLSRKQWGLLLLIGLIGGGIPFLLFFKGLALISAAQGSFIQKTMFLYVAILALVFLKEKMSKNFLAGAVLLLAANFLMLKGLSLSFGRGDLLVLAATLLWAVENVISKYTLKNLPGNIVAGARMFFGSIFIAVFLLFSGQMSRVFTLGSAQIGWVAITAILLFGYNLTWYNGLKYVPVSVAAAILMLGSSITTLLTAISTGKINSQDIFSGFLILAGLMIILNIKKFVSKMAKSLITNH